MMLSNTVILSQKSNRPRFFLVSRCYYLGPAAGQNLVRLVREPTSDPDQEEAIPGSSSGAKLRAAGI